jgi:hypothetical protein
VALHSGSGVRDTMGRGIATDPVITSLKRPAPTDVHNFSVGADEPAPHTPECRIEVEAPTLKHSLSMPPRDTRCTALSRFLAVALQDNIVRLCGAAPRAIHLGVVAAHPSGNSPGRADIGKAAPHCVTSDLPAAREFRCVDRAARRLGLVPWGASTG